MPVRQPQRLVMEGADGRTPVMVQPSTVIDVVEHSEPAAQIRPDEAAEVVEEQHATWVMLNAGATSPVVSTGHSGVHFEPVVILTYSRCPKPFHAVLCDGPELDPVRAALEHAHCRWHLPGGAKVFVSP